MNSPSEFVGPINTINFDNLAEGAAANTAYQSLGVEFSNVGNAPVPILYWSRIGRVTTSPRNVIATVSSFGGTFSTFLDVKFDVPQFQVGALPQIGWRWGILPQPHAVPSYLPQTRPAIRRDRGRGSSSSRRWR